MFGDSHVHQSPALASIALMWFRYHNHVARRLARSNPDWGDQQLFERARRIVIATWQVKIFCRQKRNRFPMDICWQTYFHCVCFSSECGHV